MLSLQLSAHCRPDTTTSSWLFSPFLLYLREASTVFFHGRGARELLSLRFHSPLLSSLFSFHFPFFFFFSLSSFFFSFSSLHPPHFSVLLFTPTSPSQSCRQPLLPLLFFFSSLQTIHSSINQSPIIIIILPATIITIASNHTLCPSLKLQFKSSHRIPRVPLLAAALSKQLLCSAASILAVPSPLLQFHKIHSLHRASSHRRTTGSISSSSSDIVINTGPNCPARNPSTAVARRFSKPSCAQPPRITGPSSRRRRYSSQPSLCRRCPFSRRRPEPVLNPVLAAAICIQELRCLG